MTNNTLILDSLKSQKSLNIFGPMELSSSMTIEDSLPSFFIDGGVNHKHHFNLKGVSVGDGDSSHQHNMDIKLDPRKDSSDLDYFLALLPRDIQKINVYGFFGGELDQQLISLGSLIRFLEKNNESCEIYVYNKFSLKIIATNKKTISFNFTGEFSLLNFKKNKFKILGSVDYPIEKQKNFEIFDSELLHNIAKGEFEIHSEKPFMIYR